MKKGCSLWRDFFLPAGVVALVLWVLSQMGGTP